jgi:hypothetical protein
MKFNLRNLGTYRVEKTEDYDNDPDRSWGEMIRIKGSKAKPPGFPTPSHLYKYSENAAALYMKDHKALWTTLKKMGFKDIDGEEIDKIDVETVILILLSRFNEVAAIVPFIRNALRKNPLSEEDRKELTSRLGKNMINSPKRIEKYNVNFNSSIPKGNSIPPTLDSFISGDY